MKIIIAQLEFHVQKDQETSGHPDRQSHDIQKRESLVTPQIAKRDAQIVFYHLV
jgi:hypothetical protein